MHLHDSNLKITTSCRYGVNQQVPTESELTQGDRCGACGLPPPPHEIPFLCNSRHSEMVSTLNHYCLVMSCQVFDCQNRSQCMALRWWSSGQAHTARPSTGALQEAWGWPSMASMSSCTHADASGFERRRKGKGGEGRWEIIQRRILNVSTSCLSVKSICTYVDIIYLFPFFSFLYLIKNSEFNSCYLMSIVIDKTQTTN